MAAACSALARRGLGGRCGFAFRAGRNPSSRMPDFPPMRPRIAIRSHQASGAAIRVSLAPFAGRGSGSRGVLQRGGMPRNEGPDAP